jgi:branched-chain amino acid transport system ATP-binding protein
MRFFRPATRDRDVNIAAERALTVVGLANRAEMVCGALSHGEQRQLELAMILATEPEVLLLDEPLAGMGPEESERMIGLLRTVARDHTLVLVEHDMDAVFSVADDIAVMVQGRVVDNGPPDQVRRNPAVQEAYLGSGDSVP